MMEGRLGHAVLPAERDNETFLAVAVNADASKRATKPTPLNLAIVVDRSGSMKGARLANAIAAARTAVGRLQAVPTSATGSFWTDVLARLPAKSCPPCGGIHRWHHFRRTCAHGSMAVDALDRSLRCPSGLIALWALRVT